MRFNIGSVERTVGAVLSHFFDAAQRCACQRLVACGDPRDLVLLLSHCRSRQQHTRDDGYCPPARGTGGSERGYAKAERYDTTLMYQQISARYCICRPDGGGSPTCHVNQEDWPAAGYCKHGHVYRDAEEARFTSGSCVRVDIGCSGSVRTCRRRMPAVDRQAELPKGAKKLPKIVANPIW